MGLGAELAILWELSIYYVLGQPAHEKGRLTSLPQLGYRILVAGKKRNSAASGCELNIELRNEALWNQQGSTFCNIKLQIKNTLTGERRNKGKRFAF